MAGDEPSNPYAPPVSAEIGIPELGHARNGGGHYRMNPNKLALMSLLTLGLYDLAFFWRHWRAIRNAGEDVSIFFRTLFGVLYCFALTRRIEKGLVFAGLTASAGLRYSALLYFLFTLIDRLAENSAALSPQQVFLVSAFRSVASIYPLVQIQRSANRLLDARGDTTQGNDGIRPATLVVGCFGLLLWGLLLLEAFVPDSFLAEPAFEPELEP